jgi:hypothetical protein
MSISVFHKILVFKCVYPFFKFIDVQIFEHVIGNNTENFYRQFKHEGGLYENDSRHFDL